MNNLERVQVGDRVLLVSHEKALDIRLRIRARQEKNKAISRDLRQSGILPSDGTSRLSSSAYKTYQSRPNHEPLFGKAAYEAGKKQSIETRWQEFLKSGVIA